MKNHYKFPTIRNISDVLPLIQDRKEFAVTEKEGGYTVINYHVQMDTTFPEVVSDDEAILRELRGIIFSTKTGEVMARRLHKFFNAGEREETSLQFIDLSKPHVILEKLDGSMITPLIHTGILTWGTKMGVTDVAMPVVEFVLEHPIYAEFSQICMAVGLTPIFEWCSRQQKIVLDYAEDQLVLIAIRDNLRGTYMKYGTMCDWIHKIERDAYEGGIHKIQVVKAYTGATNDIRDFADYVKGLENAEGFVVRFDDGHMVKVKADWYVQLHRAKDVTKFEKNVLEIILEDKLDDLLPLLEEPYKSMVVKYRDDVQIGMMKVAFQLISTFTSIMSTMAVKHGWGANVRLGDKVLKREFAVHHVKNVENKEFHSFLYSMWDGDEALDLVREALRKACSSQNRVDNCRWLMDGVTYLVTADETADV